MHAAGDDAVPKGIRRDDASAARPKKKSSADATQPPTLSRAIACVTSDPSTFSKIRVFAAGKPKQAMPRKARETPTAGGHHGAARSAA